jgi:hypothetical protein
VYEEKELAASGRGPVTSRQALRLALGAAVAALLLAFFFRGLDWVALRTAFHEAEPWHLAAVAALTVAMYACRAWRWGYLLAPLTRARFPDLFSATTVGFMTGLVIPRAGEVVRPYLIGRRQGVRASAAFASIILERLIDLIVVLLLFGLYLYVLPLPAQQTRGPLLHGLKVAGALTGLGALVVLGVLVAFQVAGERALRPIDRVLGLLPARLSQPLSQMLRHFTAGLAVLRAPLGHLLALVAQSLVVWLLIALGLWINNLAFGIHLPFHSTFLMLAFLTVGVAVPTPGMVGGFHEFYLLALTQAFGVDKETAAAAGIAAHALTNLPVLFMGLALLPREGLTFRKVAHMTEEAES